MKDNTIANGINIGLMQSYIVVLLLALFMTAMVGCTSVNSQDFVAGTANGISAQAGFGIEETYIDSETGDKVTTKFSYQSRKDGTWYRVGDLDLASDTQPAVWRVEYDNGKLSAITFAAPGDSNFATLTVNPNGEFKVEGFSAINSALVASFADQIRAFDTQVELGAMTQQERDKAAAAVATSLINAIESLGKKALTGGVGG